MSGNLLDPDREFGGLGLGQLMEIMSETREGILRRGRALMELGRRASSEPALLEQVATFITDPSNRQAVIMGTFTISQAGAAGLVSGGAPEAVSRAKQLVDEWSPEEQSDFAWLMRRS